jgi:hypothetical protein
VDDAQVYKVLGQDEHLYSDLGKIEDRLTDDGTHCLIMLNLPKGSDPVKMLAGLMTPGSRILEIYRSKQLFKDFPEKSGNNYQAIKT